MKKKLLFINLLLFNFFYSQCTISGADQIQVGERQAYQATDIGFSCTDCHEWSHLDQKVFLENDTKGSEIILKGALPGEATLKLEVLAKGGNLKCQKSITVIAPTKNLVAGAVEKCNIDLEAFFETRIEGNKVMFEPEIDEGKVTYLWTVTYRSGSIKTSTDKKPQFDYSNQEVIDLVELQVKKEVCTKKVSKMYDTNFWYFF